jgi:hypothetical protein
MPFSAIGKSIAIIDKARKGELQTVKVAFGEGLSYPLLLFVVRSHYLLFNAVETFKVQCLHMGQIFVDDWRDRS